MNTTELIRRAELSLSGEFARLEDIERQNTRRLLDAFAAERIATRHFAGSTGYGYGDEGRDALERVYARVFGTQAALVRPALLSGTHAIATALFALLRPGQRLLSGAGKPYDTLDQVIGTEKFEPGGGSLRDFGIGYDQVELKDGRIDAEGILSAITGQTGLVLLQRSCGYAARPTLSPHQLGEAAKAIKQAHPHVWVMVDNCYGEFTDVVEPTHLGADLIAGSLIKNPGGGLAPTGGYLCGREELIRRCAARLTCPGVEAEIGSYEGGYRLSYQGLFLAPHVVTQALKTAHLYAKVFTDLGYEAFPSPQERRYDIIQTIRLGSADKLVKFCQAVQAASPVEGYVKPEPWDMPGYTHPVIMAAGTFVSGASIELSCDGPLREPYTAFLQGSLTYAHGVLALEDILKAIH